MKPGAVIPSGVGNYGYYRRVFGDLDALAGGPRDPLYWAQKAKQTGTLPRLYLACGTEDSLFPNNTVMRKELEGLGADVTWFQGPGAHSWQFWDQEIKKAVPWMLNAKNRRLTMKRREFERTTPEAVGLRSEDIEWLLDELESGFTEMHGLMIMRHGKVCAEGWWAPYGPGVRHGLQSLSKTYAATAVGIACTEGLLHLDDKVIDIFPDEAPEKPSENLKK